VVLAVCFWFLWLALLREKMAGLGTGRQNDDFLGFTTVSRSPAVKKNI
jgi:hypothetical protein